jgi:collagenase-like PrtC family protease
MKKLLLLMMATILCLNTMAQQDAEGYWDITQKQDNGSTLRFLQSPENRIKKKAIVDKYDTDIFVSYYNILTKETSRKGTKIQYKIAFDIEDHIDFDVVKNNRLLIKLKNGQLITLRTNKDCPASYMSDGKYHAVVSYVITTQQLNSLINVGATKFRIETQLRNLDVEPDFDVAEATKEYKTGLYDRLKNKKDSFTSGF